MFHWKQRSALVVLFYWSKLCSKIKEQYKLKTSYLHLTVSYFFPEVLKTILLTLSFFRLDGPGSSPGWGMTLWPWARRLTHIASSSRITVGPVSCSVGVGDVNFPRTRLLCGRCPPLGWMGGGCGCINQVGDLCPIVMHLYFYLYESIK